MLVFRERAIGLDCAAKTPKGRNKNSVAQWNGHYFSAFLFFQNIL